MPPTPASTAMSAATSATTSAVTFTVTHEEFYTTMFHYVEVLVTCKHETTAYWPRIRNYLRLIFYLEGVCILPS